MQSDPLGNAAMDWPSFVHDVTHGRTHVLYGLVAVFIASLALISDGFKTGNPVEFYVGLVDTIGSIGCAVDVTAHLYYH